VVVIAGAGRAFSAGYDLTEEVDDVVTGPLEWRDLLERTSPSPCASGIARAGHRPSPRLLPGRGLELAMACD
jgi:hypothetical protein